MMIRKATNRNFGKSKISLISAMCQPVEEICVNATANTRFWLAFALPGEIFVADGCSLATS